MTRNPTPRVAPKNGFVDGQPVVGRDAIDVRAHVLSLAANFGIACAPIDNSKVLLAPATTKLQTLDELFEEFPSSNWAAPCGRRYGLICLRFDSADVKAGLEKQICKLPDSWIVRRGERVYCWFRTPIALGSDLKPRAVLNGLSVESVGIIPGTVHPSGERYFWDPLHAPPLGLAQLPMEWFSILPKRHPSDGSPQALPSFRPRSPNRERKWRHAEDSERF